MNYALLIVVFATIAVLEVPINAFSEELTISAEPTLPVYNIEVFPSITGKVTDAQGEPLRNIYVYALFPSDTVDSMTRTDGSFFLRQSSSMPVGNYTIEVYARSDTVLSRTTVSFAVQDSSESNKSAWLSNETAPVNYSLNGTTTNYVNGSRTSNLVLQQIEIQKLREENKLAQNTHQENQTNFVELQREQVKNNLQQDLLANSREIQQAQNRDSFASFVSKLDSVMHTIFWDQFEFTQKISDAGYQEKVSALNDGKTPHEAMNAFHAKASSQKKQLIDYMEEINVKYGFANSTIQNQFDQNGKLRNQTDNSP